MCFVASLLRLNADSAQNLYRIYCWKIFRHKVNLKVCALAHAKNSLIQNLLLSMRGLPSLILRQAKTFPLILEFCIPFRRLTFRINLNILFPISSTGLCFALQCFNQNDIRRLVNISYASLWHFPSERWIWWIRRLSHWVEFGKWIKRDNDLNVIFFICPYYF